MGVPEGADGLRRRKEELRARLLGVRAAIPRADRERRSEDAARLLLALPEAATPHRVLAYLSFGSEVSTAPVLAGFRARGVRLAVPVLQDGRMESVDLPHDARLVPSSYGAMEPAERVAVAPREVDLVVAPGLAFDRSGRRVGYGGGYFDGYLGRVRGDCAVAGLCFAEQIVEEVPAGPRDIPVRVVVTDREVIRPANL